MSTRPEPHAAGRFRFWMLSALAVVGIGIAGFLVFLLVLHTVYAWGLFGGFLIIALVFLAYGWMYDRRHPRGAEDY
jgi:hypothetical protein